MKNKGKECKGMNETKINQILKYLENGGIVTDAKAVEICKTYRLSGIIYVLRHHKGLNIQDMSMCELNKIWDEIKYKN